MALQNYHNFTKNCKDTAPLTKYFILLCTTMGEILF